MRTELDKFKENQVYLIEDGTFLLLISVDPVSKIKKTEKDRIAFYHVGRKKMTSDEFDDNLFIVENEPTNSVISFDISKNYNMYLSDLRKICHTYIGTLTDSKLSDLARRK